MGIRAGPCGKVSSSLFVLERREITAGFTLLVVELALQPRKQHHWEVIFVTEDFSKLLKYEDKNKNVSPYF